MMYQCLCPPRVFLSVGVGLLIFSLTLGWISFAVPDWLKYNKPIDNSTIDAIIKSNSQNPVPIQTIKFGLWRECYYWKSINDFSCKVWSNTRPTFVLNAQVLITVGLTLGSLALLSTILGCMARHIFTATTLISALCAFLGFIFATIGVTVFATDSMAYVERFNVTGNDTPRCWGLWLFIPNLVLSFFSSIFLTIAALSSWCEYRSMEATGILSHAADKYGGSVMKAPSESATNITSTTKKPHYTQQQQMTTQDYPNTCYQINGSNNNQNSLGYPPPPSYGAPSHQTTTVGTHSSAYQNNGAMFGYSRAPSPTYPHTNIDSYHHRHHPNDGSDVEDSSRTSAPRRHSRACRHSSRRSRSRSPRDGSAGGNSNAQDNTTKQPQFIPIPVPYYQPPTQPLTMPQATAQTFNTTTKNNNNLNTNTQPLSYIIQPPKQQFVDDTQPTAKISNVLTYPSDKPQMLVSNSNQPVYTIAYRANNGGNILTSNFLSGPAATTYVTATRDQIAELNSLNDDSDNEVKTYRSIAKNSDARKSKDNEIWTWHKL